MVVHSFKIWLQLGELEPKHDGHGDAGRKAADNVNVSLMKGDVKSLVLSNDDKVVYLRALKALKPTGTALDLAAHQFAELVKVLGGASPLEAALHPPTPDQAAAHDGAGSGRGVY